MAAASNHDIEALSVHAASLDWPVHIAQYEKVVKPKNWMTFRMSGLRYRLERVFPRLVCQVLAGFLEKSAHWVARLYTPNV